MLDVVSIKTMTERHRSGDEVIVYPEFRVKRSKDLMFRGKSFYAVWDERKQTWSKDEYDVGRIVDEEILERSSEEEKYAPVVTPKLLLNFSSNKWNEWQKYCKSLPDNYKELDTKVLFSNDPVRKEDYSSHRLSYPLEEGSIKNYEELMKTLYEEEERQKIEWAIGSVISGDSKRIQKFLVLYGGPGTGKSTVINLIQSLFEGYWSLIDAKALTNGDSFGLESLKENPLIAIQHDSDLSRIEDNSKLNSVVSHEKMVVNEKFKSKYELQFHSLLIMATNKPIKITDSKSGVIRRLIDVQPTGNKVSKADYDRLMEQIRFEYSGIAYHCLEVFRKLGADYYNKYIPEDMFLKTNDLYNFVEDNYDLFTSGEDLTLKVMWRRYKEYCDDANIQYPMNMRNFRDEMRNYFAEYKDRWEGKYSVYIGFLKDRFKYKPIQGDYQNETEVDGGFSEDWLKFDREESLLDQVLAYYPAQYAKAKDGTPSVKWSKCETKLKDLDTKELHYVKCPEKLIVIDFDLKNEEGGKDRNKNIEEAMKWPPTYAELSKSGSGIHLHYWTDLDTSSLSRVYGPDVEVKVFSGNSSLRRQVTRCNGLEISVLNSGLPFKEDKRVLTDKIIKSERSLRKQIIRNLRKEIHPYTKPSIDLIKKILDDAYESGMKYDVTDMRNDIQTFALQSTHQSDSCLRLVGKMQFRSEEPSENVETRLDANSPIVFFDVEIFPNLFIFVWKQQGEGREIVRMFNPRPEDVEELVKYCRLVGYNNRKYDNHILYARMMGYNEAQLYDLSQRIISGDRDAFFGEAYNLSYTDIYDFLSAQNKMSLKKWEIKLGIHHQELGLPWDKPVPRELWEKAGDYCINDVVATEAVWDANQADWTARKILAEISGLTVNDTTNNHTTKIIVGDDRNPQSQFIYTDLSTIFPGYEFNQYGIDRSRYNEGTKIVQGKSIYMGEDPSEGGYAIGFPGMYVDVALLDIAAMHPHSAIALNIFGDKYTKRFKDLVDMRDLIKHKHFNTARKLLEGALEKYLQDEEQAGQLSGALKTGNNSVYGLTSASFPNRLRDPRNVDNIVAKYGALFMITLKHKVQEMAYTVVHIKTDSIKIANADQKIIDFVMKFGKEYGYTFEHEATYSRMCIVNDAVYIARYAEPKIDKKTGKEIWWTATGTQFQIPYVFKTLFSKEPIEFEDLCETKSVSTAMYLDFNEGLPDITELEEVKSARNKIPDWTQVGYESVDKANKLLLKYKDLTDDELEQRIAEGHDYRFVGKVGSFCPMKGGIGGGLLLREIAKDHRKDNRFASVTGTKSKNGKRVYRWMEAEMVKTLGLEDQIDRSYYNELVDEAIDTISQYGDFERFVSDEPMEDMSWMNVPKTDKEEVPFEEVMNPPTI